MSYGPWAFPNHITEKVTIMLKRKSDPFLAQTSAMLVILLVVYALGADTTSVEHLILAR
jgi:hypothetical protein